MKTKTKLLFLPKPKRKLTTCIVKYVRLGKHWLLSCVLDIVPYLLELTRIYRVPVVGIHGDKSQTDRDASLNGKNRSNTHSWVANCGSLFFRVGNLFSAYFCESGQICEALS